MRADETRDIELERFTCAMWCDVMRCNAWVAAGLRVGTVGPCSVGKRCSSLSLSVVHAARLLPVSLCLRTVTAVYVRFWSLHNIQL